MDFFFYSMWLRLNLKIFFFFWWSLTCHSIYVEIKGQCVGAGSVLPCRFKESNLLPSDLAASSCARWANLLDCLQSSTDMFGLIEDLLKVSTNTKADVALKYALNYQLHLNAQGQQYNNNPVGDEWRLPRVPEQVPVASGRSYSLCLAPVSWGLCTEVFCSETGTAWGNPGSSFH